MNVFKNVFRIIDETPNKRLTWGAPYSEHDQCSCLLGVVFDVGHTTDLASMIDRTEDRKGWCFHDITQTGQVPRRAAELEISPIVAMFLEQLNDWDLDLNPEERYRAVHADLLMLSSKTDEEISETIKEVTEIALARVDPSRVHFPTLFAQRGYKFHSQKGGVMND